jgi:hypothetical protein
MLIQVSVVKVPVATSPAFSGPLYGWFGAGAACAGLIGVTTNRMDVAIRTTMDIAIALFFEICICFFSPLIFSRNSEKVSRNQSMPAVCF